MTDLARPMEPHADGYPIKLVRDNTPAIINSTGDPGDLFYRTIPVEERLPWLKKKLGEEVLEYLVDGGVEELQNVLAVCASLCRLEGKTMVQMLDAVVEDPRGIFSEGVMMYGLHPEFDR